MALIFLRVGFIILGLIASLFLFFIARKTHLRWWPAYLIRLFIIITVLFTVFSPRGEFLRKEIPSREILLIDNSASIDPDVLTQLKETAIDWVNNSKGRIVLVASETSRVLLDTRVDMPIQDSSSTDLVKAIRDAGYLLGNAKGKIILVSDGYINNNDAVLDTIVDLHSKGIVVEILPLPTRNVVNDYYLGELVTPTHQWEDTPFEIQVPLYNISDQEINQLKVTINGNEVKIIARQLKPNLYGIRIPPQKQGTLFIQVFINVKGDPNLENNVSYGIVQIYPAPTVMIVSRNLFQSTLLKDSLSYQNINTDIVSPEDFPLEMENLRNYKVIFLHNLLASELPYEIMKALRIFVIDLGGGVVFLGGNYSYTLGDYKNTILEPILPVKLEPPPRHNRTPITLMLILDRSGSMALETGGKRIKLIDLAREAAMRSLETIGPDDYLGVITYESDVKWDIPLAQVGEGVHLRRAMDIISSIQHAGKTSMYLALTTGLNGLAELPAVAPEARNILLLTDGKSSDGSETEFDELAQYAKDKGITISTIGLGKSIEKELLCMLAETTGGRCYLVVTETDLPNVMVAESEAIRSENIQTGETTLLPGEENHPVLSGVKLDQLPRLNAYNALTSKADQGAEDILRSANFGDPILSVWQYGLGRVVAWMSDVGEVWTQPWNNPANESLFWSQVVRYTLVNPAIGPIQVDVKMEDRNLVIDTRIEDSFGIPVNLAKVEFDISDKEGHLNTFSIPQIGPGEYNQSLPWLVSGSYQSRVMYMEKNGTEAYVDVPFAVNLFNKDFPLDMSIGKENTESWVQNGAKELNSLEDIILNTESKQTQRPSKINDSSWLLLLLGLVMSWPIEIAIRRQWLPWLN